MCYAVHSCSVVSDSVTPCTITRQPPRPMEFFRQENWSGLPFPHLEDLSNPVIKPPSPAFPALAGGFLTTEPSGNPEIMHD